jgi:aspartate/tyrosine/aromatic aminotransferase
MAERRGLFKDCPVLPPTVIFDLTARFKRDAHPSKLNLGVLDLPSAGLQPTVHSLLSTAFSRCKHCWTGVGAYRDEDLKPVVFSAVRKAEAAVISEKNDKEYLPVTGLPAFNVSVSSRLHCSK